MTPFPYHLYTQLHTQQHSDEESIRQLYILQVSKYKPQMPVILKSLKWKK